MIGLRMAAILLGLSPQEVEKEGDEIHASRTWIVQPTRLPKVGALRITRTESWAEFWKAHTGKENPPPPVDFEKDMVLVFPIDLAHNEGVVRSAIRVRETTEALRVLVRITTTFLGAERADGAQARVLAVSIAVVPRSLKKVEFYLQTGKPDAERPKLLFKLP